MNPIFSIIIPIYNSEETILNSFNSIKNQKIFKKTEVILIDDASTDSSKKICKNLEKENNNVRTIFNITNLGVSRSRNKGIKVAKGDYLIFLESDDSLCPKILDKIRIKIKAKRYDVLYLNKELKKNYYLNNSNLASQNINKLDNFTCHCWNFIIQREFLIKNNIFFKNIKIFEDQVFVTELIMLGKNFFFFKKKILNHFEYASSLSRKTDYFSAISCIQVIKSIILKNKSRKLRNSQIIFINKRINFMFSILKIYFLSLKFDKVKKLLIIIKDIVRISKLKKEFNFLKKTKLKKLENNIIKERNYLKFQFNKSLVHKKKKYINFIFSCGILGRSLLLIAKLHKIKIKGFLENNRNMIGNKFLNHDIVSPNILLMKNKYEISKIIVFIVHTDTKTKKILTNQLTKYNISKKNIIKLSFFKHLKYVR